MRFAPSGTLAEGGRIDIRVGNGEITIADNGIGFDPRFSDRIFDAFTRLNSKDQFEGTGLGLALSKKIVQRHGGEITAQGHLEQGATFSFTLPVVA